MNATRKKPRAPAPVPWPDSPRLAALRLLVKKQRGLVVAGKFETAFALGERIAAMQPPAEVLEALMFPVDEGLGHLGDREKYDLLRALTRRPPPKRLAPWHLLLKSVLLDRLHWSAEAMRESEALAALPRRYGWMRWHRGIMLLNNHWDCSAAKAEFAAVLESAPQVWKAPAILAEIALIGGDRDGAFRTMARLLPAVAKYDRAAIQAWTGEMHLWIGEYREALRHLDPAVASNDSPLSLCWRGAAQLKLGHVPQALADLDAQLKSFPEDQEALVWRGEAKRLAGRWREALADLDAACRFGNSPLWAYLNRALVRGRLQDIPGLRADYLLIPSRVRSYFAWKLGREITSDSPPRAVMAQLEAVLEAARGVRRSDQYLYGLWLKPLVRNRSELLT